MPCSDAVESELEFVGLIVFENKLKPETAPVIRELHEANIRNVMVTGTRRLTYLLPATSPGRTTTIIV